MIFFALLNPMIFENSKDNSMMIHSILRFLGGIVLIIIWTSFGHQEVLQKKSLLKSIWIIIPAFIISINNFPIIAFLDGRATLMEPIYSVYLFLLECLSVGFFEEIVFRGIILIYLVKRLSNHRNGLLLSIIISSAIFGLIHAFNFLNGASLNDTILQIGYSFLVGMMWAVMYLKTGNIWLTMILHATYNFFGQVMFYLGNVNGRYDIYTILMTIVFAAIAAVYSYKIYKQILEEPLNM